MIMSITKQSQGTKSGNKVGTKSVNEVREQSGNEVREQTQGTKWERRAVQEQSKSSPRAVQGQSKSSPRAVQEQSVREQSGNEVCRILSHSVVSISESLMCCKDVVAEWSKARSQGAIS